MQKNAENSLDKIQHPYMTKIHKLGIEGNFLILIQDIYKNTTVNTYGE